MTKSADIDPLLMEGNASQLQHTFSPEKSSSYLAKLCTEIRNEVPHDLKSTKWRRTAASYFKWLGFSIWAPGLIVLCVIFPLVITPSISLESSEYWNYCAPDGSFSLDPTNPWNPDWTFQIVLAFGSLSFTQAKVIDIVWDIVSSDNFKPASSLCLNADNGSRESAVWGRACWHTSHGIHSLFMLEHPWRPPLSHIAHSGRRSCKTMLRYGPSSAWFETLPQGGA